MKAGTLGVLTAVLTAAVGVVVASEAERASASCICSSSFSGSSLVGACVALACHGPLPSPLALLLALHSPVP